MHSSLARSPTVTTHNLALLRSELDICIRLELDVLDQERPHIIAEAICFQMPLERQPGLDLTLESFRDAAVELCEDFHGELWFDAAIVDQFIDSVDECFTDTEGRC